MNKILDMFKGLGNRSVEMGRVMWFMGGAAIIVYQGYAIFKGQNFDPIAFGAGFAAILAAGGFGIAQKDNAAPANKPVQVNTVSGDINTENVSVGETSAKSS